MQEISINIGALICSGADRLSPVSWSCTDPSRLAMTGNISLILLAAVLACTLLIRRIA